MAQSALQRYDSSILYTFTLVEFSVISCFFYLTFSGKYLKWFVVSCFPIFFVVYIYNIVYNGGEGFDSVASSTEGILVIIFCILFFYEQLKDPEINFVYASKTFWIVIGCLIYASATLFLFISYGLVDLSDEQRQKIWVINVIGNIIRNLLFTIALYKPLTMKVDSSSRERK